MDISNPSAIESETRLSKREAEFFVHYYVDGLTLSQTADAMGVKKVNKTFARVKAKRDEAEKTIELFEEVESSE